MARRKKVNPIPTSDVPLPAPIKFATVSEGIKVREGAIAYLQASPTASDQRALAAIGTARSLGHRVYVEVDNGVLSFMAD